MADPTIPEIISGKFGPVPTSDTRAILEGLHQVQDSIDAGGGGGGGGGGGSPVEPNFTTVGASDSFTIPSGTKGWTVSFLSGTGTLGGQNVGVGFSDGDSATTSADIIVTTDANSSAYIRYGS